MTSATLTDQPAAEWGTVEAIMTDFDIEFDGSPLGEFTCTITHAFTGFQWKIHINTKDELCDCAEEKCTCIRDALSKLFNRRKYRTTDVEGIPDGTHVTINVDALLLWLESFPTHSMAVSSLKHFLNEPVWMSADNSRAIVPSSILDGSDNSPEHMDRIESANLQIPIVIVGDVCEDEQGKRMLYIHTIVDGYHRLARAVQTGSLGIAVKCISTEDMLAFRENHFPPIYAKIIACSMQKKYELTQWQEMETRRLAEQKWRQW